MDPGYKYFVLMQTWLTSLRERFKACAQLIRSIQSQWRVRHAVDFSKYSQRDVIELFLEVATANGAFTCWWIDVTLANGLFGVHVSRRTKLNTEEECIWEEGHECGTLEELAERMNALLSKIEEEIKMEGVTLLPAG